MSAGTYKALAFARAFPFCEVDENFNSRSKAGCRPRRGYILILRVTVSFLIHSMVSPSATPLNHCLFWHKKTPQLLLRGFRA